MLLSEVTTNKQINKKKKAPLDLDKQCGVITSTNNLPCRRSLTCKMHSMGAKRAVEGRSRSFNELLALYQQKKGQTAINISNTPSIQQKEEKVVIIPETSREDIKIDFDEEAENIRFAIEQSQPCPLRQKQTLYVQRRRKYHKVHDSLLAALTPKERII
ncbi:MAG: SCA7, zinc-binding domain-containing protein [Benjaminiella poitrasii]|nr:MAG: SCA7, zinc-binding domain-containing protein [Benjaminiella poitrasii]